MAKNIAASRQKQPGGLSDKVSDIVLVVICAAVMLIVAYPLYYVLVASFSDPYDVYAGKTFLLPSQFTLKGYQAVFADSALFSGFINSIKYTVIGTIYSVVMIYLVAYPLSVKDLPGRKYISLFFVITMYFGGGLVPYYMVLKGIHMLNTFWVFIFPLMMSVYNMILVRSYVESMPESLFEAAKIDGATELTVFFRLVLPLSKPILMTIGLFVAVNQWNSWFDAYLYTSAQSLKPMQSVLVEILNQYQTGGSVSQQMSNAKSGMTVTPDSIRMAATMVATIPILCQGNHDGGGQGLIQHSCRRRSLGLMGVNYGL